MIKEISKITGIAYDEADAISMDKLRRIAQKFPLVKNFTVSLDNIQFVRMVKEAASMVEAEGELPLSNLVAAMGAAPGEKRFKIKSSPKGSRIKVAAANGVRFSFGPVWNESVKKVKGIAVIPANRVKLNHQAMMLGIAQPEILSVGEVCNRIAAAL